MPLTTHEKIRVESGFQSRFTRQKFVTNPDGVVSTFYVRSDDPIKFVPEFSTGGTIAGVSDVKVYVGLSGVQGSSRMTVSSIDIDQGAVTVNKVPDSGASLTINYASSAIPELDIESVRLRAESMVSQRLSLCYDLPLSPVPSVIADFATRLASSLLLMKDYGDAARDTSRDGWAIYDQLMGSGEKTVGTKRNNIMSIDVGEIGLICTPGYQLVDDDGSILGRNDEDTTATSGAYTSGGRTGGRIYDITEEPFRKKDYQQDVDRHQAGSANTESTDVQG